MTRRDQMLTSAVGVTAAIQARKKGRTVPLPGPGRHPGGSDIWLVHLLAFPVADARHMAGVANLRSPGTAESV